MPLPKLSKLELQIMEALWTKGACSVREIQEFFPAKKRPAYTTVQTTVYRMEVKKALRRTKKIATALIFEAAVTRESAERRLIDELLGLFGGRSRPIMAHLVDSGTLTLEDVREAEQALLKIAREGAGEEKAE
jgi:BlaI family penicillinase repressor